MPRKRTGRTENDLQKVAQDVGMHLDIRYDKQLRHQKEDWSSPAIMRNPQKCILCGRCGGSYNEIQESTSFRRKTVDSIR